MRPARIRLVLLLTAVGASLNLALTFVPDLVPSSLSIAIVLTTTVTIVISLSFFVLQSASASRKQADLRYRELETAVRNLRGIVSAGNDREHSSMSAGVWSKAHSNLVVFGFGFTTLARDPDLIRVTADRGVDIEIVKIDPEWLESDKGAAMAALDYFAYDRSMVELIKAAHNRLERIAESINESGTGRVSIYTYRGLLAYRGLIADPATPDASGYVEFDLYQKTVGSLGVALTNYSAEELNPPLLLHVMDSLENAVGRRLGGGFTPAPDGGHTVAPGDGDSSDGSRRL